MADWHAPQGPFEIASLLFITLSYSKVRPWAIFPKWRSIRHSIRRLVRMEVQDSNNTVGRME